MEHPGALEGPDLPGPDPDASGPLAGRHAQDPPHQRPLDLRDRLEGWSGSLRSAKIE